MMLADKRKRPRMRPPFDRGYQAVVVVLGPADYRLLHEAVLRSGTSMAETLRGLIRRADMHDASQEGVHDA